MLRKFSVKNFKGFKDEIVLDLAARDYAFNPTLVKNGIVNKGLIYGKNGTGKTNIGLALFDITTHLLDKVKPAPKHQKNYANLDNDKQFIVFKYEFEFDGIKLRYEYSKVDINIIFNEFLYVNDELVLYHDNSNKFLNKLKEAEGIDIDYFDPSLSVLKFVYARMPKDENSILFKLFSFVENMLWFRSLGDGNNFIGFDSAVHDMNELIINNNKLTDFEQFLRDNELNYHLIPKQVGDKSIIYAKYAHGEVPFTNVISSGTNLLWLYYCWSIVFDKVSFLFMDEFDAYYHYETAENIVKLINSNTKFQAFLTTHNTYLMKNSLTRPDCCFIISKNKIKCLADCTDKEIREAHNLEKMYVNGAFNE